MVLDDFLMPGETVCYLSPEPIEYQGDIYDFCITNTRLIWHKRTGLIFKSDKVVAEYIGAIDGMSYEERGILSKKGIIKIRTTGKKLEFSGSKDSVRAIYVTLQSHMGKYH